MIDWDAASLQELIQHIVGRHHAYLWSELPSLDQGLTEIIRLHGPQPSLLGLQRVFRHFRRELEGHLKKEEEVLFPLIAKLEIAAREGHEVPRFPFGPIANPIGIMEQEHGLEQRQLEKMREVTSNYTVPPEGSEAWRGLFGRLQALETDLRLHVRLEDDFLFPRACRLEVR